jgi:hypothetical protein
MREENVFLRIGSSDTKIGIRPDVLRLLADSRWGEARDAAQEHSGSDELYRGDGIAVVAGPSWQEPFTDQEG